MWSIMHHFVFFFFISWQKLKISIHYYLYNELIIALLITKHLGYQGDNNNKAMDNFTAVSLKSAIENFMFFYLSCMKMISKKHENWDNWVLRHYQNKINKASKQLTELDQFSVQRKSNVFMHLFHFFV